MVTARRGVAALLATMALLATACSTFPESSADVNPAVAAEDLGAEEVVLDQTYAQRASGPLGLDLYLPERPDGPVPLVVYIHGGSWEGGTRTLGGEVATSGLPESLTAQRLVREGYAVATVDYRLSGVEPFPAPIEDVTEAVRWLRANAGKWGLDPDRIALWGASAGGHIAALTGVQLAGDDGELKGIRAVVNWFGPSDMSTEAEQDPRISSYARGVVRRFLGCTPSQCPAAAEKASPLRNLSGDEPPFLIQHGTADELVPVSQSLDFAAELRARGTTVEMHPYEGVGHGFPPGVARTHVIDAVVGFLDRNL